MCRCAIIAIISPHLPACALITIFPAPLCDLIVNVVMVVVVQAEQEREQQWVQEEELQLQEEEEVTVAVEWWLLWGWW